MFLAQLTELFTLLDKLSESPIGTIIAIGMIAIIVGTIITFTMIGSVLLTVIRSSRASDKEQHGLVKQLIEANGLTATTLASIGSSIDKFTHDNLEVKKLFIDALSHLREQMKVGFRDGELHYTGMATAVHEHTEALDKNTQAVNELVKLVNEGFQRLENAVAAREGEHVGVLKDIRDTHQELVKVCQELATAPEKEIPNANS